MKDRSKAKYSATSNTYTNTMRQTLWTPHLTVIEYLAVLGRPVARGPSILVH